MLGTEHVLKLSAALCRIIVPLLLFLWDNYALRHLMRDSFRAQVMASLGLPSVYGLERRSARLYRVLGTAHVLKLSLQKKNTLTLGPYDDSSEGIMGHGPTQRGNLIGSS